MKGSDPLKHKNLDSLRLINKSAYANDVDTIDIEEGVEELLRILGASISTLKKKLQKP